jgi:putative endonuclease
MRGYRQKIGTWGEKLAEEYLISKGYQVMDRNYRTPYGEIDIIACKAGVVILSLPQ